MTDDFLGYLPLQEAADRYNLTYGQLLNLISCGYVRRIKDGRYTLVDIASLEDWLPPPGWIWMKEAKRKYALSTHQAYDLIHGGKVRTRKRGHRWQVELVSLEAAIQEWNALREVPPGWITADEVGKRLGVTSQAVRKRVLAGQLRGRRFGKQVFVEEASLEELFPPGWVKIKEAARKTGRAAVTIEKWIQQGRVRARKAGGEWIIEEQSLEEACRRLGDKRAKPPPKEQEPPPGWTTVKEATRRLRLSIWSVRHWIRTGRLRARRQGRRWLIEETSLEELVPAGWITAKEAAERAGVRPNTIIQWIQKERICGRKASRRWYVDPDSLGKFTVPAGYIRTREATSR